MATDSNSPAGAHGEAHGSGNIRLSLPQREQRGATRLSMILQISTLTAVVAAIVLLVLPRESIDGNKIDASGLRDLAIRLEQAQLNESAIGAWRDYLGSGSRSSKEDGAIWFRIGKLYEDTHDYESAVDAYYRAESAGVDESVGYEISTRVADLLERLGRYAALRRDLESRTSTESDVTDNVVAEIGATKIYESDLDRLVETVIADQLSVYEGIVPAGELAAQKEELFRRYANADQRMSLLGQYIGEELLARYAREEGIAEDSEVRDRIIRTERTLLAQSAVRREIASRVNLTKVDLENFYSANEANYTVPERARIRYIVLDTMAGAESLRERAVLGEDFARLASTLSIDEATAQNGGAVDGWINKGDPIPGIGQSTAATAAIFSTDPGKVCDTVVASENGYFVIGVTDREPSRVPQLAEIQDQVYRDLYGRKSAEIQQQLLEYLQDQYDVVVHEGVLGAGEGETEHEE